MTDKILRAATIRLAHEKPELREHLLPLLKSAARQTFDTTAWRTSNGGEPKGRGSWAFSFGVKNPDSLSKDIFWTVNGVNFQTGKVGVVKETHRSKREQEDLERSFWIMNQLSGSNVRAPKERDTRWIPANQIVKVVERLQKPNDVL